MNMKLGWLFITVMLISLKLTSSEKVNSVALKMQCVLGSMLLILTARPLAKEIKTSWLNKD